MRLFESIFALSLQAFLAATTLGQGAKAPSPKLTCLMQNHSYWLSYFDKAERKLHEQEKDDWFVNCKIVKATGNAEEIIFNGELKLVHPCSFVDASLAVEEFRTKTAPKIIKGKK